MEESILKLLRHILDILQDRNPNDGSEKGCRYTVMITELEKIFAYCKTFIENE